MSTEFEPLYLAHANKEFSIWHYHQAESKVDLPEVTQQEQTLIECERLKEEAIQQGYTQGLLQAQTAIARQQEQLTQWLELLQQPVQLLDDALIQELVQTILWICQYCIGVELSVAPQKIHTLFMTIKEELPVLGNDKKLFLHPADMEWIATQMAQSDISGLHEILTPDPELERGDFYLKGAHHQLDGRLQTRLQALFAKTINKSLWNAADESL